MTGMAVVRLHRLHCASWLCIGTGPLAFANDDADASEAVPFCVHG